MAKEIILDMKNVLSKAKRPMVLIQTDKADRWVTSSQWDTHGYSPNLEAYKGGTFEGDFYAVGEKMMNGDVCRDADRILKQFVCTQDTQTVAITNAALIIMQKKEISSASALFRRNNPIATVAAPAAPAPETPPVVEETPAPEAEKSAEIVAEKEPDLEGA
jgi:hypothetical protein